MLELKLFIYEHKPERVMAWRDRKSEGMVKREKRRLNMLSDDMSFGFSEFLDFSVLCACHCQLPQKWQQLSLHILLLFNFLTECIRQIFSWNEFVRGTILVYCLLKIILRLIWEFFFIMIAYEFSHNNIHFHLFVDDALSAINVVNCITFTKRKKHVLWTSCSWTVIDFSALLVGGGIFVPPYHLIFFCTSLRPFVRKRWEECILAKHFFARCNGFEYDELYGRKCILFSLFLRLPSIYKYYTMQIHIYYVA